MGNIQSSHVKTIEAMDYFSASPLALNWNVEERSALTLFFEKCGWTKSRPVRPPSLSSSSSSPSFSPSLYMVTYTRDLETLQTQWLDAHSKLVALYSTSLPLMVPFLQALFSLHPHPPTGPLAMDSSVPFPPLDLLLLELNRLFKSKSCAPALTLLCQAFQPDELIALLNTQYTKFKKKLPDTLCPPAQSPDATETEKQWLKLLVANHKNAPIYLKMSQSFFYEALLGHPDASVMVPAFPRSASHSNTLLHALSIWYLCHGLFQEAQAGTVSPAHSQATPSVTTSWCPVYRLQTHGQNWHAFTEAIIKAGNSPWLMIVKDTQGFVFGASARSEHGWKLSPHFTGEPSYTRLFTLHPSVGIYTPSGQNTHYHYLNDGTASLPNGLGFGGQLGYFGLFIASDLQSGSSESSCSTFGPCFQSLASSPQFQIENIELWSLDGHAYGQNSNKALAASMKKSAMATQGEFLNMLDLARAPIRSRESHRMSPATDE